MSASGSGRVIRIGARATKKFLVKAEDVRAFGNLIEDHNPIHSDVEAARAAGFPSTICYGMFAGSLFSGLMATELPGPSTVYLSQNLRFTAPVFVGDELEVSVEVTQFRKEKGLIAMNTVITKVDPVTKKTVVCIEGSSMGLNKIVAYEGESYWEPSKRAV